MLFPFLCANILHSAQLLLPCSPVENRPKLALTARRIAARAESIITAIDILIKYSFLDFQLPDYGTWVVNFFLAHLHNFQTSLREEHADRKIPPPGCKVKIITYQKFGYPDLLD